ncbi:MAG: hypothetical protein NT151_08905 [Acidobacteria bacterium]|nr:hypothetical protein [Acidobacteriota bacterium]
MQHWTNFYDPADSVSALSHNLAGAENVEVNWRPSGLLDITPAHVKIWTNEKVIKWMTARVGALRAPPKKSRTVEDIVAEWEKEHPKPASKPAAGGSTPATPATPAPATKSQPNQQAVAKCESDYQEQARQISANTHWNYSGLASWSDGCPTAERAFTACYEQTCKLYRDGGISKTVARRAAGPRIVRPAPKRISRTRRRGAISVSHGAGESAPAATAVVPKSHPRFRGRTDGFVVAPTRTCARTDPIRTPLVSARRGSPVRPGHRPPDAVSQNTVQRGARPRANPLADRPTDWPVAS